MQSMYVNGKSTSGQATGEIEVLDPATEEVIDSVPRGTPGDIEAAVAAARNAFPAWRSCPANERAALLHEVAARLRSHQTQLIDLLTREQGKPSVENEEEVEWS
ncbi:MAG: aldehyde dehydrogenase family protein, partial [Myxococcota bacterium]|nr:aldehyde dehydrogenase family protein [Myxococcota bacterium]